MFTSALRTERNPANFDYPDPGPDGPPALEVRAVYKGVIIGTRFLSEAAPKWRLRSVRGLDSATHYMIGQSSAADAPVASEILGGTDMPLISKWGGGFLVNVTPNMTGNVAVGGKVYRLADYLAGRGSNFTLPANSNARIDCGAMSFQLRHTHSATRLPRRWFSWRWDEQKFTLGSLLALGLFLLMIFAVPPETMSVSGDLVGMSKAMIPFTIKAPEPEPIPDILKDRPETGPGEAGKALAGEQGKLGRPDWKKTSGAYQIKGDGKNMHLGKTETVAQIQNKGILGVLNTTQASRFNSIFGTGTAVGDAESDIMGNLIAANIGDGFGNNGFGMMGTGYYGGGTGLATIGTGNFNTLGGPGYGHSPGWGNMRRHITKTPTITPGIATVRGSLDKEIIRRVVRLHMNEVKYCYDQELVRKAGLEGRVSVQFVISTTGQVISSFVQSTTMNNARVESCVAGAVRRWDFPKPTGGGIAIVSYPFNFVAGAGN